MSAGVRRTNEMKGTVPIVLLDEVRKRIACVALALLLVAPTLTSEAQPPLKIARIGYLSPLSAEADSSHREADLLRLPVPVSHGAYFVCVDGAMDGSNQAGAMVTCQAITTSPGAGWAAAPPAAAKTSTAAKSETRRPARQRRDVRRRIPICASRPGQGPIGGEEGSASARPSQRASARPCRHAAPKTIMSPSWVQGGQR